MDKPTVGADIPASASGPDIAPPPEFSRAAPQGQYSEDGSWFWNGTEWVPARTQTPVGPGACIVCGGTPATLVTFRSVLAFAIFGITTTQRGVFCRDCGLATFRERMNMTLVTGWWGPIHFFINLGVIVINLSERARLTELAAPTRDPTRHFLSPGRPVFLRAGFVAFAAILLLIGGSWTILALAFPSEPFPPEDVGFLGDCTQLTPTSWSVVDCTGPHDGKIVSLGRHPSDCPSLDDLGNLPDGNFVCIDNTK